MWSSSGEEKFKCEPCGKSYKRKAELDRHNRTSKKHNSSGTHQCGCCGRWFTRDDARLRHERSCEDGSQRGSSNGKGKDRDSDMNIDEDKEEES